MSAHQGALHKRVDTLYKEHHSWLKAWLRGRLGCPEQAADLAQDTFVRILAPQDALSRLSTVDNLRGYLTTIARRLMVDQFRRARLEQAWLETLAQQPQAEDISPEQRLALLETLHELDCMLDGLGQRVKRAFLLSQLQGMTYASIATELGCSEITIHRYIAKAVHHCLLFRLENLS